MPQHQMKHSAIIAAEGTATAPPEHPHTISMVAERLLGGTSAQTTNEGHCYRVIEEDPEQMQDLHLCRPIADWPPDAAAGRCMHLLHLSSQCWCTLHKQMRFQKVSMIVCQQQLTSVACLNLADWCHWPLVQMACLQACKFLGKSRQRTITTRTLDQQRTYKAGRIMEHPGKYWFL